MRAILRPSSIQGVWMRRPVAVAKKASESGPCSRVGLKHLPRATRGLLLQPLSPLELLFKLRKTQADGRRSAVRAVAGSFNFSAPG